MGAEFPIGEIVQMLMVWVPVLLLFVAVLRLLWRAGDRHPNHDLLGGQQQLQAKIDALALEIRDLKQQVSRH